jgi:predicted dehydrogenase
MNPGFETPRMSRRDFAQAAVLAGAGLAVLPNGMRGDTAGVGNRIRTAVVGCGSVSNKYLPNLVASPHVQLVSLCDLRLERARAQSRRFGVGPVYANLAEQLAGEPFDLLVNLTDMQAHEELNRMALEAGRHVWSEKPLANSLEAGQALLRLAQANGLRLWGAPIPVLSPQFRFMARMLAEGRLGRVAAAHADYGHEGPGWSAFFYERLGGSLPDLAVYQLTTLTGLLGPARSVTAMVGIVTPEREVADKGRIRVTEEDNAMVLMDHGNGVFSHVQSGFNYFNPHGHEGHGEDRHTVKIVGSAGYLGLVGYDWAPSGVDIATKEAPRLRREVTDAEGYVWEQGAALAAEVLATGRPWEVTPEHALHVLEIITAAREASGTGRRVDLQSRFRWPVVPV